MYRLAFVDAQHALGDLGAAFEHAAASLDEAESLHEVVVQVATLNTCLEVLALLNEQGRAAALMAPLEPEVLGQMPQLRDDLRLSRAKVALLRHDTGAAAQALTQISEETTNGRISAFRALLRAELALAQGDAAAALAVLPAPRAEGINDEFRLRSLALRVRACTQTLTPLDTELRDGLAAALGTSIVHATAASYLHVALVAAAARGLPGVPASANIDAAAHLERLCASLHAHPRQQQALRERAAALGSSVAA